MSRFEKPVIKGIFIESGMGDDRNDEPSSMGEKEVKEIEWD